ncbi:MAG TPA: SH3 domain-containing protein [Burkholderiales bacterium]|nr:SH3 domain-containing protein [Burkholderiales bacterium]
MRARLAALTLLAIALPAAAGEFRSIAENATPMYDAPSVRAKKLFVASRYYPVEIVINIDNWVKVRDQAGDLAWVEKKSLSEKRTVIVIAPVADVRRAASEQAPLAFQARQGVALDVVDPSAGGWIEVRHADGQTGFVKVSQVWGL